MSAPSVIPREEQQAIAAYLAERISGPVALEVWTRTESRLILTDRDPCTYCDDVIAAARILASLHPAISLTLYDMDRHADRASEANVDRPPLTVVRGRGGRTFRVLGMWSGLVFSAMLDAISFAAAGSAPLKEESQRRLASLEQDLEIEVMGAPYDAYSAHMLRLGAAVAMVAPRISLQFTELSEFPILATQRAVTEVPVISIGGRRFSGAWEEDDLVEQIMRVASGDDEPVIRDHVPVNPYLTAEQAQQLAAEQAGEAGGAPLPTSPGGLLLPRG